MHASHCDDGAKVGANVLFAPSLTQEGKQFSTARKVNNFHVIQYCSQGKTHGKSVGLNVGINVGVKVGLNVGIIIGLNVGVNVGIIDGINVGLKVGIIVGLNVGLNSGLSVGLNVGIKVGDNDLLKNVVNENIEQGRILCLSMNRCCACFHKVFVF